MTHIRITTNNCGARVAYDTPPKLTAKQCGSAIGYILGKALQIAGLCGGIWFLVDKLA